MLEPNKISSIVVAFLEKQTANPIGSPSDQQEALKNFGDMIEGAIYTAIKDMKITIAPGSIVCGAYPNAAPVILISNVNLTIE